MFDYLFKGLSLSKVLVFSWPLLLDPISVRLKLARRRVLDVESSRNCIFYGMEETTVHIFFPL